MVAQLVLQDDERTYLTYIARRIDREVRLLREGQQDPATTVEHVQRLAALAEEILGKDELPGWLEATTRAPELAQLPSRP